MYKCNHFTDSIFYQFEQTAKYCKHLGLQIFQKLNLAITIEEFAALDVVMQNDGICQRELAKIILKDRANTGKILNSLEGKGYIKRNAATKNNRLVRELHLTTMGEKIVNETLETLNTYLSGLPKVLSEAERTGLIDAIKTFRKKLEKEVEMKI